MSIKFRRLLSGDPNGVPPWLEVVKSGTTPGYFLPSDAPWVVHASFATLVGGIRALLMQALHPGTLKGVSDHSRYEKDPLGRLAGTIRWLTITTFGSMEAIENEAARVNRLHKRVLGNFTTGAGQLEKYSAMDPDLMLWVHITFMESFIVAHLTYSDIPVPGGKDNYIDQWSVAASPLGLVANVPRTSSDLDDKLTWYFQTHQLRSDSETRKVIKFIKNPPLPILARPVYGVLYNAAVASLRVEFREMLGLKAAPAWIITPLTRWLLRSMRLAVGSESPIEEAAKSRLGWAG